MVHGYKDKHSLKVLSITHFNKYSDKTVIIDEKTKRVYSEDSVNDEYWDTLKDKKQFQFLLKNYLTEKTMATTQMAVCISNNNGKFKNLTVDKEYSLESIESGFVVIVNNRNETARYAEKYFKIKTVDVKIKAEVKKYPDYKIMLDYELVLDSLTFVINFDSNRHRNIEYNWGGLNETESNCGCGITEYSGINHMFEIIKDIKSKFIRYIEDSLKLKFTEAKEKEFDKKFIAIFSEFIIDSIESNSLAIFSTNITNNDYLDDLESLGEELMKVLVTETKKKGVVLDSFNVSSINTIRTFIMCTNEQPFTIV